MSLQRAFLTDVRDNPGDDTPRLVLADWLEDNGESDRAAFIRAGVERARLTPEDDRHAEIDALERRLLLRHAADWLPASLPAPWTRFRRGLPEVLAASAGWLTDEGIDEFGPLPLRELRLAADGEYDVNRLKRLDLLSRVETFSVGLAGVFQGTHLRQILGSGRMTKLRKLGLEHNGMGYENVRRLLVLDAVEGVETLYVEDERMTDATMTALLARPWPNLRWLAVRFNRLSADGFSTFVRSDLWRRLDAIAVEWQHAGAAEPAHVDAISSMQARSLSIEDHGGSSLIETLCQATRWGRLERLVLWRGRYSVAQIARLVTHPAAAGLRELYVSGCGLDSACVQALADAPLLTNLTRLWIDDEPAFGPLARSQHLRNLTHLHARGTDDDAADFLHSDNADHVRWLHVPNGSDVVAAALAASSHLGQLATLSGFDSVSDDGAVWLAEADTLPNLTHVRGSFHRLTQRGQAALLEAEHLGWIDLGLYALKSEELREAWRQRYGDGARGELIDAGWPEWNPDAPR